MTSSSPSDSRLLALPLEIREVIYDAVLDKNECEFEGYKKYRFDLAIFQVSRQIYHESRTVFRRKHQFVAIETPWPEAQEHAAVDGHVPIILKDPHSKRFQNLHMMVTIDAPYYASMTATNARFRFVILVDDLPQFTTMWYYQDLTHRGLNDFLRLTLDLKNPYASPHDDRPIPKALQSKLLMPFGRNKSLNEIVVQGDHYSSIEKSMRDEMAEPYKTPEACLDDCTRLKDEGNAAIAKQMYHEAIRLYVEAFHAMHIVCKGRIRHIWGDRFFQKDLVGGQYDKQEGLIVRLVLRVKLVANMIQAYVKLADYEEAKFWGMRTITTMREALRDQDFVPDFVAGDPLGKIYYRTGVAFKALGDKDEARSLLRVAEKYLPNDQNVKKELASVALRLG
jgi:tetratricopeptide (TPR) repeat protein